MFLEEYPNNKRDQKTLEELILKRVQLGTKILEDGWSSYEHFQELSCVVFVCCRMTLMLTSHWDFINHSENFRKPEDDSVHTIPFICHSHHRHVCVKKNCPV